MASGACYTHQTINNTVNDESSFASDLTKNLLILIGRIALVIVWS